MDSAEEDLFVLDPSTGEFVQITTGTGARLMHRRHRPSIGPPIWEHPAYHVSDIRGGANDENSKCG